MFTDWPMLQAVAVERLETWWGPLLLKMGHAVETVGAGPLVPSLPNSFSPEGRSAIIEGLACEENLEGQSSQSLPVIVI